MVGSSALPALPSPGAGRSPPRSARSRRALGPRRAALRRYKRPRSLPTRNPRLRPVPASRRALNPRPDRPLRNRLRPGPVRDARPGAPAVGTMGAAQSASEEIRELVGKTGCEYRAGHGRGDTAGAAGGFARESQPTAACRASRRLLCDLGLVAGPLCAQPLAPCMGFLPATLPAAARSQRGCWKVPRPLILASLQVSWDPRPGDCGPGRGRAGFPRAGQAQGGERAPGYAQLARRHLKVLWLRVAQGAESFEIGRSWVGSARWPRSPFSKTASAGLTSLGSWQVEARQRPQSSLREPGDLPRVAGTPGTRRGGARGEAGAAEVT